MALMQRMDHGGDLGGNRARASRRGCASMTVTVQPRAVAAAGDFEADEAAADDRDPGIRTQPGGDGRTVVMSAQIDATC